MVMATGSVCHPGLAGELLHEVGETNDDANIEAAALHERLVAYVHALSGGAEARSGVWVEHSYARARGAPHAAAAHVRVLLAPRLEPEPGDVVDVESLDPPPPELPSAPPEPCADSDADDGDDEWEARVTALAPTAVHARLADRALDALRRMRLELLAAPGGRDRGEAAAAGARRLRLALAAAGAAPAPLAQRPAGWLHATLHAYMPGAVRRLYDLLAGELRRAAPRLAERMMGGRAPPPRRDPLAGAGPPVPAAASPWLVWLGGGRARADARWCRRLGALLHVRALTGAGPACAPPDVWCAAAAGALRAALAEALDDAGERPVILGGAGAGAALCILLATGACGARLRGLLLLAPPLLTAEGARDTPDDPLTEVRLPMLMVVGTGAAQCWRGAAREAARGRAGGPARRVLELRGADDALRLPRGLRRRRRLPQHALDAAVAEECARWAVETATSAGEESPARERPRRREPRPAAPASSAADDEEYAHLPSATSRPAPPTCLAVPSVGTERPIEIVGEFSGRRGSNTSSEGKTNCVSLSEGRVVSRGSGGTPLALLPPRRRAPSPAESAPLPRRRAPSPAEPAPPPRRRAASPASPAPPPLRRRAASPAASAPLAAADIMRLPIVFADDELGAADAPASPVTVRSGAAGAGPAGAGAGPTGAGSGASPAGAGRYTRVIVASRGRGRGSRPVLLRRGLRLLPH